LAETDNKIQDKRKRKSTKIIFGVLIPLLFFLFNAYLLRDLFFLNYTKVMGSIESVFIADARFIAENGFFNTWLPQWYLGFPFRFFYPPLFHFFNAFIFKVTNFSLPVIYHFTTAFFYSLGALNLYFFVRYLTKRNFPAVIAALLYTVFPSFSYLIPSVKAVASNYYLAPWRLVVLLRYGEGPHISALSILPLVLLVFLCALRNPSFKSYLLASLSLAVIPLTNWPAAISLAVSIFVLLVSEMLRGESHLKLKRALLITITAYAFSAFWLSFSYIYTTFSIAGPRGGGGFLKSYLSILPWLVISLPLLIGGLLAVFNQKKERFPWSFVVIYGVIFSVIIFSGYSQSIKIIPESNRFTPEWNMGMVILVSLILNIFYQKLNFNNLFLRKFSRTLFSLLVLFGIIFFSWPFVSHAGRIIEENPDIKRSVEYEIASWLKNNTNGERVYATGSIAFWLNVWTDIPQVRGGSDQGATNPWFNHVVYQINTSENAPLGKEGELAILWLKAFNVRYLVFNRPNSREVFHDFKNPYKFEGLLDIVYDNKKGDIIYKVPLKSPSLAQVVAKEDIINLSPPKNAVDYQAVKDYAAVVDDRAKEAKFTWLGPEEAKIKVNLKHDEVVQVQITYHGGWRAFENEKRLEIKKDPLGFMLIECGEGEHEIILRHGLTLDEYLGYFITISAIILIIFFRFKKGKKWLYEKDGGIKN